MARNFDAQAAEAHQRQQEQQVNDFLEEMKRERGAKAEAKPAGPEKQSGKEEKNQNGQNILERGVQGILNAVEGVGSQIGPAAEKIAPYLPTKPMADVLFPPTQPTSAGAHREAGAPNPLASMSPESEKALSQLSPEARAKVKLQAPGQQQEPDALQATAQAGADIAGRIAKSSREGYETMRENMTGVDRAGKPIQPSSIPIPGTGTGEQPGMAPEAGQANKRIETGKTQNFASRAVWGTLGFLQMVTPIMMETGSHVAGELNEYINRGTLTDELVKSNLRYLREQREAFAANTGGDPSMVQQTDQLIAHWERWSQMPQAEREAEMRAGAEMAGGLGAGLLSLAPGLTYTHYLGKLGKAVKGSMKGAEAAGVAGVGKEAEAVARAAQEAEAGKAEWAKRMAPEAAKPAQEAPEAAKAAEAAPAQAAAPEPVPGTTKAAGEAEKPHGSTPPDIQAWAEQVVQSIKGPGDLEGQLRASVEATKKAKAGAKTAEAEAERAIHGNVGQVGAVSPEVALAMSRAAVGAVIGGMLGEDPEGAALGAAAGLLAPKGKKLLVKAFREGSIPFAEGQRSKAAEKYTTGLQADEMAARTLGENGGMSYDPHTHQFAEFKGYFVGVHPSRGETVAAGPNLAADLKRFAAENADLLDKDPKLMIGTEKVTENGRDIVNIDLSRNTADKAEAMALGKEHKQYRIFGADEMQSFDVPEMLGKEQHNVMKASRGARKVYNDEYYKASQAGKSAAEARAIAQEKANLAEAGGGRFIAGEGQPVAQVSFKGYQEGYGDMPGFELFNLEHDIPGHPKGSTVTAESIAEAGYRMPPELENALAPRDANQSAFTAMGGTKAMTEAEGKAALAQVRANEAILADLRKMREAGRYEPTWLETIWDIFRNQEGRIGAKLPKTEEALKLMNEGLIGTDWYAGIREELQKHFGDDWQLVADIIAATSPNTRVAENVDMALHAYAAYKRGEDIGELASKVPSFGDVKLKVQGLLEGKSLEQVLKSRDKVWHFSHALKGDLKAVVIDRWMWKLFYPEEVAAAEAAGKSYKGTSARYKATADWITKEAAKIGLEPAELQAGLWCAKKVADGDPAGIKPLREYIASWVAENKGLVEGLDFFQNIGKELPGMNQAGKIELGTMMLLARAIIGGTVGASLGEDPMSMGAYALMGTGVGAAASFKVMRGLRANLKPSARQSLEDLATLMKNRPDAGLPPTGEAVANIPREVFGEFAKQAVPPKDLKEGHKMLNDQLAYQRRLAAGGVKLDSEIARAATASQFKNVEDVFTHDLSKVTAEEAPKVIADMKAMNAFVMEDLTIMAGRAKLLNTGEAADALAKKFAYAGRYSQRVSDAEKALGKRAIHPERMQAIVDFDSLTKEISTIEQQLAGVVKDNKTLVEMITRTQDRYAIAHLAEQGSRVPESLWNIYYGLNLLSSPLTQVKNVIGNVGALGLAVADRAVGEGIDFVRHPFKVITGASSKGVQAGETFQMVGGIFEKLFDSARASKRGAFGYGVDAFWSGESVFGGTSKAGERLKMLAAKDMDPATSIPILGKFIDTMSMLAQYNLRFMQGTDEFFKMLSYHGELRALARRESRQIVGRAGKEANEMFERLLANPSDTMLSGALAAAHENTFTKEFKYDTWGGLAQRLAGHELSRIIATPFFRTPMRVQEFGLVHTPGLNLLAKQFYSDLIAGGAKAELAWAKLAVGTMVGMGSWYLASDGTITGDWPKSPALVKQLKEEGWQPRSVYNWYNGKYYSYAGLQPLEDMLAGAANFSVAWPHLKRHDMENIGWATILTYSHQINDNPYLQGISDVSDALGSVDKHEDVGVLLRATQKRMLSMMPGASLGRQIQKSLGQGAGQTDYRGVKQTFDENGMEDVNHREVTAFWGKLMQQVPGYGTLYGEGLMPELNYVTGKPTPSSASFLGGVLPWQISTNQNDRVIKELVRLGGARLPKEPIRVLGGVMPRDSVIQKDASPLEGVPLTKDEQLEFAQIMSQEVQDGEGRNFYEALDYLMFEDPRYEDASDSRGKDSPKATMVHDVYQSFREKAEREFKQRHPEIANVIENRALHRHNLDLPKTREDEAAQRIQDLQDRQMSR